MITKGKQVNGLKFNVFYRGSKLVVEQVSTEWEAKRRALIIFASWTGNVVKAWELSVTRD
jgi:hypothetical protein